MIMFGCLELFVLYHVNMTMLFLFFTIKAYCISFSTILSIKHTHCK